MEGPDVYQWCYNCVLCCSNVKTSKITIKIKEEPDISIITKLQFIAPEIEWSQQCSICEGCRDDLLSACVFKERCLKSQYFPVKTEPTLEEFFPEIKQHDDEAELVKFENVPSPIETHPTEQKLRYYRKEECSKCGRKYATVSALEKHGAVCDGINRHHDKSKARFKCGKCNKRYMTNKILKAHIKTCDLTNTDLSARQSTDDSRQSTDNSNQQNVIQTNQPELTFHRQLEPNNKITEFTFTCEVCEIKFTLLKDILNHCETAHSMDPKTVRPYTCETCDAKFRTSSNLKDHQRCHVGDRPFICTHCGKSFRRRKDFIQHEQTHFNVRAFKCESCEKAFKTSANLRTHKIIVHTSPSKWKNVCKICGKRFPQKCTLDTHVRRHLGEKNFFCPVCDKGFTTKDELRQHVGCYHCNMKPFKCEHCEMEYKHKSTYKIHLKKVHGIGNVKLRTVEKKFACHVCPAKFPYKTKLTRHLCVHYGLKPYACTSCDQKFTDRSYLNQHLKVKHNSEDCL